MLLPADPGKSVSLPLSQINCTLVLLPQPWLWSLVTKDGIVMETICSQEVYRADGNLYKPR
jgi:hypothetical protein